MAGISRCPVDITTTRCCCHLLAQGKSDGSCTQGWRCLHATHSRGSALGEKGNSWTRQVCVFSLSKRPFNVFTSAPGWRPLVLSGEDAHLRDLFSRGQMSKSLYVISHFLSGFAPSVSAFLPSPLSSVVLQLSKK